MKTILQKIASKQELLVNFYTTWCGTCNLLKPELEKFTRKYGELVEILEINLDQDSHFISNFKIIRMPTLIFFRDGKEVWRKEGLVGAEEIYLLYEEMGSEI